MLFYILIVLAWMAGSYGVYSITQLGYSPWWIVVYGLATIALFVWLVVRANKKASS
jgi:drug/metabolite transporter superfamily protein YnfA